MSGPFQPGDVVVCINEGPNPGGGEPWEPKVRWLYRIADVFDVEDPTLGVVTVCDLFEDPFRVAAAGWAATMFRKIDEDVTESFREQMRSLGKQRADAE